MLMYYSCRHPAANRLAWAIKSCKSSAAHMLLFKSPPTFDRLLEIKTQSASSLRDLEGVPTEQRPQSPQEWLHGVLQGKNDPKPLSLTLSSGQHQPHDSMCKMLRLSLEVEKR